MKNKSLLTINVHYNGGEIKIQKFKKKSVKNLSYNDVYWMEFNTLSEDFKFAGLLSVLSSHNRLSVPSIILCLGKSSRNG
jgi:hypothetical protein